MNQELQLFGMELFLISYPAAMARELAFVMFQAILIPREAINFERAFDFFNLIFNVLKIRNDGLSRSPVSPDIS
jgi:hypothetical protein